MNNNQWNHGGAATATLLGIAAFSLILTLALVAPRHGGMTRQSGQAGDVTPSSTVISPQQTPTATVSPMPTLRPTPTPRPILPVTDPTEAWVLIHRPGFYGQPEATESPTATPAASALPGGLARSVVTNRFYLPLLHTHWTTWAKGAGFHRPNATPPLIPTPGPDVSALHLNWYYDWNYKATPIPLESKYFAPMVWCGGKPSDGVGANHIDAALLQSLATTYPGRVWLIFNEPDHPPTRNPSTEVFSYGQCAQWLCKIVRQQNSQYPCEWGGNSGTPTPNPTLRAELEQDMLELAVDRFAEVHNILKAADPSARVFCCGNFFAADTTWWTNFRNDLRTRYPSVKIDGVAIHAYLWTSSTNCNVTVLPQNAWTCVQGDLEEFVVSHQAEVARADSVLVPEAPLWLTEYGYLLYNGPLRPLPAPATLTAGEVVDYLMMPLVEWLQTSQSGFQAIAWYVTIDQAAYTAAETNLFYVTATGTYSLTTPVGVTWSEVVPVTATPDR